MGIFRFLNFYWTYFLILFHYLWKICFRHESKYFKIDFSISIKIRETCKCLAHLFEEEKAIESIFKKELVNFLLKKKTHKLYETVTLFFFSQSKIGVRWLFECARQVIDGKKKFFFKNIRFQLDLFLMQLSLDLRKSMTNFKN